jgi:hypothetical protein
MELMTIKSAFIMINHFKELYPDDYQDINLTHGKYFTKREDGIQRYYTLSDLETDLNIIINKYGDNEYDSISINGVLLLNKYELNDICTLNIHSPVNKIELANKMY